MKNDVEELREGTDWKAGATDQDEWKAECMTVLEDTVPPKTT